VKKVIIRTMAISGAMCGIVGLLLSGAIEHTMSESIAKNMGFTAIMATWLAHCNPLMVILTSFLITFLNRGMVSVRMELNLTSDAIGNVCIALVYFIIIASEFFVTYKVKSPIFDKIAALLPKRKKSVDEPIEQVEVVSEEGETEANETADDLVVDSVEPIDADAKPVDDKQEGGEQ
ncbi:MAG: hypothetical protein ACI4MY_07500, partial [Christensenellales bacterium]